jgi:hypothetical protein
MTLTANSPTTTLAPSLQDRGPGDVITWALLLFFHLSSSSSRRRRNLLHLRTREIIRSIRSSSSSRCRSICLGEGVGLEEEEEEAEEGMVVVEEEEEAEAEDAAATT